MNISMPLDQVLHLVHYVHQCQVIQVLLFVLFLLVILLVPEYQVLLTIQYFLEHQLDPEKFQSVTMAVKR